MPDTRHTLDEASARELRGLLLQLRDDILLGITRRGKDIGRVDLLKMQNLVAEISKSNLSDELERILSRYYRWSFDQGVKQIDEMLRGEGIADILNLPEVNVDQAAAFSADKIRTIVPALITSVSDTLSLMFVGVRTPAEIQKRIAYQFDVSIRHAETIVRTEIGRTQNKAAESRIQQTFQASRRVNIPMLKIWTHSSGKVEGFAKGRFRAQYEPRPHHKAMHGATVGEGEKFKLTNPKTGETWHIDGPHDEVLPAGEVINCYCRHGIVIDREAYKRQKAAR